MKTVILAGGLGTRISEETKVKPKPMVEIGGMPILWHIMKIYSFYGHNDFIICCGYKGEVIKEFFLNYVKLKSDITIDFNNDNISMQRKQEEKWKITLVDTGADTMTGGRLKRVKEYLKDEKEFFFTYGDGVADVNINDLLQFHKNHGKLATMTAAHPPGRFGALQISGDIITDFKEKPKGDGNMVNAGFFVLSPDTIKYIEDDNTTWENEPLFKLAKENELMAFKHSGFWQPMDTIRDKNYLENQINNNAPWIKWK